MISPVLSEQGAQRSSLKERSVARIAVGTAMVMCRLSPSAIRGILIKTVRTGKRPPTSYVIRYRRLVASVSTFCAGEGCLPRSIAIALVARMYGYGVTWCTGVKDNPFVAHAWVEIDGKPIGEVSDLSKFNRLMVAEPNYVFYS